MVRSTIAAFVLLAWPTVAASPGFAEETADPPEPAWTKAHLEGPLSADETREFMKELARFVFGHQLKKDPNSPQRGMVYEYFDVTREGEFDQFVQGEGLDTMHDGAWLAAAMVSAYRATGDPFYKEMLSEWQLPFYLKMLNHSDELFTAKRNDARPGATPWGKPWAFQEGEKGFVPYFWDDGGSVSMERRREKNPLGFRPCVDHLAGKPNPNFLLDGYSQGMSNHMSQDLGVMLQLAWLLLKDSDDPADVKLAAEVAQAAVNLHESRVRHFGYIPMCVAPAALAAGNAELMRRVPRPDDRKYWAPSNHCVRALVDFEPGERYPTPGFADGQEYVYYYGIARSGGQVPEPLAFKTIYDAYTEPLLYRYYSDDAPVPAGINRFDLHTIYYQDGRPVDYRSDRKGPGGGPRPIGSRYGPQNMVCCGWALQMLRAFPSVWEARYAREFRDDLRSVLWDSVPGEKATLVPMEGIPIEAGKVSLCTNRTGLGLFVSLDKGREIAVIKLHPDPGAKGDAAVLTLRQDGTATAVGPRGEKLRMEVDSGREIADGPMRFRLTIPFTAVKGQTPWINLVDHGRYSIAVDDRVRNVYVAGKEKQVKARLEHELGAGLRTWRAIFRETGYIPTGIGAGANWDGFSDSGGYAHLISACAQWLLYLDGKNDWEVHDIPNVLEE